MKKKSACITMYRNGNKEKVFSWLTLETKLRKLERHYSRGINVKGSA